MPRIFGKVKRHAKRNAIEDLVALGWDDEWIGLAIGVSGRTVRTYRLQLQRKVERLRRMQAAREELGGRPFVGAADEC